MAPQVLQQDASSWRVNHAPYKYIYPFKVVAFNFICSGGGGSCLPRQLTSYEGLFFFNKLKLYFLKPFSLSQPERELVSEVCCDITFWGWTDSTYSKGNVAFVIFSGWLCTITETIIWVQTRWQQKLMYTTFVFGGRSVTGRKIADFTDL